MAMPAAQQMNARYDNTPILLTYTHEGDAYSFRWTSHVEGVSADWSSIDAQHIIGLLRASNDGQTYDLLFVIEEKDGKDVQKVKVHSIRLEEPPEELAVLASNANPFFKSRLRPSGPRLQIVVSVASGTGLAKNFLEHALRPFLRHLVDEHDYDVHLTTSADSIINLTKSDFLPAANKGTEQAILLLAGDGGLVDVLFGLFADKQEPSYVSPQIALIPLGTGNALANSTRILDDKTVGLRTLLRGRSHELPKFVATFSPGARYLVDEAQKEVALPTIDGAPSAFGCVVCSWGLHAALVADSDTAEYRKFGAERFKMAAKENLYPADGSMPHAYRGTVSIKQNGTWHDIDRSEHGYVLATLVSYLEAGFNISPASAPLDGILRLVHFGPLSGQEAMEIMGKAYQGGKHVDDARLSYEAVDGVRIVFKETDPRYRRVCIDGTIIRVEQGGFVDLRKDTRPAIALITP